MMHVFALLIAVFVLSLAATGWLSEFLRRRSVMDIPGDRSSHSIATPRGGGLAIVVSTIAGVLLYTVLHTSPEPNSVLLLAGGLFLAAISWIDDLRTLPPFVRFAGHAVVVAVTLPLLGLNGALLPFGLPVWLDYLAVGIAWLGFLNFFNFMDGIDGISVVETIVIGSGIVLLSVLHDAGQDDLMISIIIVATAGFGWWNWAPAKVFMGDVGSVFLGYVLGGYLILLSADGYFAAALILPAYYLADAVTTLIRRASRGERIWQAHRQHFYQRAVQAGRSHAAVSLSILCIGTILIALALASVHIGVLSISVALIIVSLLCYWLPRTGSRHER